MKISTIHFVKKEKPALYIQLYEAIKQDILNGSIAYGDQLPSIRKASKDLSVSKTSMENAYQRLLMEGYIIAKAQKGYFVDVDKHSATLRKMMMEPMKNTSDSHEVYDLRTSAIDNDAFDRTLWMHYLKEVLYHEDVLMKYGDPQGEQRLRDALQSYVYAQRGVFAHCDQFVVGASFQSLLYTLCSLHEGTHCVGFEMDGFPQAEQVFKDCGYTIVHLQSDEEGVCIESLQQHDIGILYINSASCGKKHRSLRSKRRTALLDYAKKHHILLIEDDHNGELRYHSKLRPAMQGFDKGEQVIYLRSFSKLLFPSLRISFMILNKEFTALYKKKKINYNPSASKIEQLALANYILDGQLDKQVRRLRKRYEHKSKCMLDALARFFPSCQFEMDESNLQIYVHFPMTIDGESVLHKALDKGIYLPHVNKEYMVLSFASIQEEDIFSVIEQLYPCIL